MMSKKGQMSISDAPSVVLVVGLTFLVMATVALIANQYGAAIPSDRDATITSESGYINSTGYKLANASRACNFDNAAITAIWNKTSGGLLVNPANYTLRNNYVYNSSPIIFYGEVYINYTHTYGGVACTTNQELETEISSNTSIAGIVLTISLVGIVLTVLVGVFVSIRRPRL